jgi:hypothetical protein
MDRKGLRFFGYGAFPRMDLCFNSIFGDFNTMEYTLMPLKTEPKQTYFHPLRETGFLFNGSLKRTSIGRSIDSDIGGNETYTGYALIVQVPYRSSETASLALYYIQNEKMDYDNFDPVNPKLESRNSLSNTRKLIKTFKTDISASSNDKYRVYLNRKPSDGEFSIAIYMNDEAVPFATYTEYDINLQPQTGFGFFTGYYEHDCDLLSIVEYQNAIITTNDNIGIGTSATAYFIDGSTGLNIAKPELHDVWDFAVYDPQQPRAGGYFRVTPPDMIVSGGKQYYYAGSDPAKLDPIMYQVDPANNIVVLRYYCFTAETYYTAEE